MLTEQSIDPGLLIEGEQRAHLVIAIVGHDV
jgi:hypothetical protein